MNRWSATLLGGLIGAILALLLAPSSGEETRRRLRANVDGWQDRTQDRIRQGRMRVTELVQSGQDALESVAKRTQEVGERSRQAVRQAGQAAQERLAALGEKPEQAVQPDTGS